MRRELDTSLAEPRIGMAAFQHYRDLRDRARAALGRAVGAPATGADFYAFSGQKWLLGPQGSGGLWVSPQWLDRAWTAQSSYWNLEQGVVGDFLPTAARFDGGTLDTVTVAGIGAAIEW